MKITWWCRWPLFFPTPPRLDFGPAVFTKLHDSSISFFSALLLTMAPAAGLLSTHAPRRVRANGTTLPFASCRSTGWKYIWSSCQYYLWPWIIIHIIYRQFFFFIPRHSIRKRWIAECFYALMILNRIVALISLLILFLPVPSHFHSNFDNLHFLSAIIGHILFDWSIFGWRHIFADLNVLWAIISIDGDTRFALLILGLADFFKCLPGCVGWCLCLM